MAASVQGQHTPAWIHWYCTFAIKLAITVAAYLCPLLSLQACWQKRSPLAALKHAAIQARTTALVKFWHSLKIWSASDTLVGPRPGIGLEVLSRRRLKHFLTSGPC